MSTAAGGVDPQLAALRAAWAEKFKQSKADEKACASAAAKVEAAAISAPAQPCALAVLSWNVWFEYEQTFADRMRELGSLVGSAACNGVQPSALALQELTRPQQALLRPILDRIGFTSFIEQADKENGYWCALATRAPLGPLSGGRWIPFTCGSMMSRGLVLGTARLSAREPALGDATIVLASTHLESFVGEDMKAAVCKLRKAQLEEAGRRIEAEAMRVGARAAVLFGDMNWDERTDGDATELLSGRWIDAWEASGRPASAQYTYDGRANGMLAHSFRNRLDRCFIWTPPPAGPPRCQVSLVGTNPIRPGLVMSKAMRNGGSRQLPVFPSDHFGLLVSFELSAILGAAAATSGGTDTAQSARKAPPPLAGAERSTLPAEGQPRTKKLKAETVTGLSATEPIDLE